MLAHAIEVTRNGDEVHRPADTYAEDMRLWVVFQPLSGILRGAVEERLHVVVENRVEVDAAVLVSDHANDRVSH